MANLNDYYTKDIKNAGGVYGVNVSSGKKKKKEGTVWNSGLYSPVYSDIMSQEDYINKYVNSLGIQKAGGGAGLGSIYSAYDKAAAADIAEQKLATQTQKADLATKIARLRQNITEGRKQQQEAYQGTRADLEESGFMATRANRASAAARGLSGSGLEQLAQLQQMMKQNRSISSAASENQQSQNKLTQTLIEGEQDYATDVSNLTKAQQVALQKIQANLAANKASAAQQAASANASATANYNAAIQAARANALTQYQSGANVASSLLNTYLNTKNTGKYYEKALAELTAEQRAGTITSDLASTVLKNLNKYYGKK